MVHKAHKDVLQIVCLIFIFLDSELNRHRTAVPKTKSLNVRNGEPKCHKNESLIWNVIYDQILLR